MLKNLSLRRRLTLFSSVLIAVCCIGLSIVLNVSAYRMADSIDAVVIQPAQTVGDDNVNYASVIPVASSNTVKQAKNGYLGESLLYTLIAVLVGGVLTYYVSGRALEPVRALNEQVKNINAHNLDESLEIPQTKDELAELTASFNDMTDKLAQAFAMQKRFSADAAHELRTPLTVLQTKLDVFRKKDQHSPEEYEAFTAALQKQIKRMRSLVTELLELADMERELVQQDFSLGALLKDVINDLNTVAEKKCVLLSLNSVDFHVLGDYDLLYRAFYNLTENAIKYNFSGGNVTINAYKNDKTCIVEVKDTGIGIPDVMKKQIFEPFCRVDKSRSREMGGAGLGLALVNDIIKKHDGSVLVFDNDGGGSCFKVTLPTE